MTERMLNNTIRAEGVSIESECESELNDLLIGTGIDVSNNCSYGCDFTLIKGDKFILGESKSCKSRVKNGYYSTRHGKFPTTKPGFFEIRKSDFEEATKFFVFTIRNGKKQRFYVDAQILKNFIEKRKGWNEARERSFLTQLEMFRLPKIKNIKKFIMRFF